MFIFFSFIQNFKLRYPVIKKKDKRDACIYSFFFLLSFMCVMAQSVIIEAAHVASLTAFCVTCG